jgi:DNA-binding NarL/FixJ family response regulator
VPNSRAMQSANRPIRVLVTGSYTLLISAMQALVQKLPGVVLVDGWTDPESTISTASAVHGADLVLLILPQQGDLERLRRFHRPDAEGTQLTPRVLCVSPSWTAEGVLAALHAGATGYLSADLTEADLAAALRQAVTGEITLSPELARDVIAELASRPQPPAETPPRHAISGPPSTPYVQPPTALMESAQMDSQSARLSEREMEILHMVCEGMGNKEIAQRLFLSLRTVENHLANVFAKLGVRSRTEAAVLAVQHGWTTRPPAR